MTSIASPCIRILVVDDSKAYALRLKTIIERVLESCAQTAHVIVATDPHEAVGIMTKQNFHVCFVDDVFQGTPISGRAVIRCVEQVVSAPLCNDKALRILVSGRKLIPRIKPSTDILQIKMVSKRDINVENVRNILACALCS